MAFNSQSFFAFLAVVFAVHWVGRTSRWQNSVLLIASYLFYGWWDWRFCLLLGAMTVGSFWSCLCLEHTKRWVTANVILWVGVLAVFKYFNFFIDSAASALAFLGIDEHPQFLRIALPIGISFYTFQIIGYTIDVFRGTVQPTRDLLSYSVAVSFFTKIATGPIEKAGDIIPQFSEVRRFDYGTAVDGCRQMLWGLFKKMVIADSCQGLADRVFFGFESMSGSMCLLGAFLYAMQIYADFSGYSDMAIGCSRLFGIRLTKNFAYPYFSRNVAEFWRRWHMSLMGWFKDYLYIPLGGNRCGKFRQLRNTFIVFLVSGLWHGANWTFVVWGLIHACLFLPLLLIRWGKRNLRLPLPIAMGLTFFSVTIAWVFFRSPNISSAFGFVSRIFSRSLFELPHQYLSTLPWIAVMVGVEWLQRKHEHALDIVAFPKAVRWAVYIVLALICIAHNRRTSEFIYFQF